MISVLELEAFYYVTREVIFENYESCVLPVSYEKSNRFLNVPGKLTVVG